MSGVAAMRQSRAVHIMTDGLAYAGDRVPIFVDVQKTHAIAGINAAVASTGPAMLAQLLAEHLDGNCRSFDELVAEAAEAFKPVFFDHINEFHDGDAVAHIVLAGWHERENRPGLYSICMRTEGQKLAVIRRNDPHGDEAPFVLRPREVLSMPCPTLAQFNEAGYRLSGSLDQKDPAADLLHQMEIQRRTIFDGRFIVGGHAELTSIDEAGCSQRVAHVWEEDVPGVPVCPKPIDWSAWRLKSAGIDVEGMSRLQRERMLRKAKKGTLRVVA